MTMTVLDRTPVAGDAGGVTGERPERPDPEVPEQARRRTFTAQHKLEVLAAYDAAGPGEKGAILRREGLYSSHIVDWRRSRDSGALAGPARPRGRPAADPRDAQIARLRKEKARLEQELAKARFVVDVQSKLPRYAGDPRHRRQIGSCWRKLDPGSAGPAGPGLPAIRGDVRRADGRVRRRYCHSLEACHRAGGPAGCPAPKLRRALGAARTPGTPTW